VLDVLIRGGWIADGTGSPPFLGDVAIEDGRIAEVGRLDGSATAALVVDASGKIV
jgi:N-acyl-D-amino-acid deacylase